MNTVISSSNFMSTVYPGDKKAPDKDVSSDHIHNFVNKHATGDEKTRIANLIKIACIGIRNANSNAAGITLEKVATGVQNVLKDNVNYKAVTDADYHALAKHIINIANHQSPGKAQLKEFFLRYKTQTKHVKNYIAGLDVNKDHLLGSEEIDNALKSGPESNALVKEHLQLFERKFNRIHTSIPFEGIVLAGENKSGDRPIGYFTNPLNGDGKLFGLYKSTGQNSQHQGTWLAHEGVDLKINKPCDSAARTNADLAHYVERNFTSEIITTFAGRKKWVNWEGLARFGDTETMLVSRLLGGGYWNSEPGKRVAGVLDSIFNLDEETVGRLTSEEHSIDLLLPSSSVDIKNYLENIVKNRELHECQPYYPYEQRMKELSMDNDNAQ